MDPIIQNQKSGARGVIGGIVALLFVTGVIFAAVKYSSDNANSSPVSTAPADTTNMPADTSAASATSTVADTQYKDGTYSAEGDYQSPGGAESIQVTLVLANGIVTDATVVSDATRPNSVSFQNLFISDFKQYVVGKNISDLNLTKVSGSSLTPKGFNDAVAKIKVEAQA